uniref:Uncharacterized protein n=1 Tax=Accipiter nisus TaxID=211598 RepID=A0A8B9NUY3_9AVES
MSNNSNKRAPTTKDPLPYICAEPLPTNIVEWHYVVWGPEMTPCEGACTKIPYTRGRYMATNLAISTKVSFKLRHVSAHQKDNSLEQNNRGVDDMTSPKYMLKL